MDAANELLSDEQIERVNEIAKEYGLTNLDKFGKLCIAVHGEKAAKNVINAGKGRTNPRGSVVDDQKYDSMTPFNRHFVDWIDGPTARKKRRGPPVRSPSYQPRRKQSYANSIASMTVYSNPGCSFKGGKTEFYAFKQ